MNYKNKIPLYASILFGMLVFVPQAHAAEFVLDDFSDGAALVTDGGNCNFSDDLASVLGGTRGIFACKDSGTGTSTSETDTTLQQFIFTLNQAKGSSGLNYDDGGNLLGGEDITDGGTNNALRLDFVKADAITTVTVTVADVDGKVGTFEFLFGPSGIASEFIPFVLIKDPVTMLSPDFSNLDHVSILFEDDQESNDVDTELILGKVSADSTTVPPQECPPGTTGIFPNCTPIDPGPRPVGGTLIPIDTTALLLAGAQMNAVWIMSALVVIGSVAFGALYITSKKN